MADAVYPSSKTYRERLSMKEDAYDYNMMYTSMRRSDAWSRLYSDASVRQRTVRSRPGSSYREGGATIGYDSWKSSGFDSNTSPAVYTHTPFKQGYYPDEQPIEQQHKITATRFKQKFPIYFMSQIRPETETTNQCMRMLGTYTSDKAHADRLGMFIPSGCPGGKPAYHPDVRTGGYGLLPTLPRQGLGASLRDGRNLK